MLLGTKTGNGAYRVETFGPSCVEVTIEQDHVQSFGSLAWAYEWCVSSFADLQGTMRGYSYLNAAHDIKEEMEKGE